MASSRYKYLRQFWLSTSYHVLCLVLAVVMFLSARAPWYLWYVAQLLPLIGAAILVRKLVRDNRGLWATIGVNPFPHIAKAAVKWFPVFAIPMLLAAGIAVKVDSAAEWTVGRIEITTLAWAEGLRHDYKWRCDIPLVPTVVERTVEAPVQAALDSVNCAIANISGMLRSCFAVAHEVLLLMSVVGWIAWAWVGLRSYLDVLTKQIAVRNGLRISFAMGLLQ